MVDITKKSCRSTVIPRRNDEESAFPVIRFILVAVVCALLLPALSRPASARPMLAVFDLISADGSTKEITEQENQYLRTYLKDLGKVDVLQVRADMTSVKRAIAEKIVTEEEITRVSDPEVRQKIGDAIGAQYALGGAIAMNDGKVSLAVELVDLKSKTKWQASSSIGITGPDAGTSLTNGLQSAANTVTLKLDNEAFQSLPKTTPAPAAAAPVVDTTPPPASDAPKKILQQAQEEMDSGKTPAAIYRLNRAIDSDPENADYRVLIARAYITMNMYDEAMLHLKRVQQMDPDNEEVLDALAKLYETKGTPAEVMAMYEKMITEKPEDARLRIKLGDVLWKKARTDDAIKSFEAAAALDPKNVDIHDRLARCYAAKSQFEDSIKQLGIIATLEPKPDAAALAARYSALMAIVEGEVKSISNQFDQGAKAYENEEHTREQYYEMIRGLTSRADTLTRFLDKVTTPPGLQTAHSHRVLACSLLSQAGDSLMSYLETNKDDRQTESQLYLSEAREELKLASTAGSTPTPASGSEAPALEAPAPVASAP